MVVHDVVRGEEWCGGRRVVGVSRRVGVVCCSRCILLISVPASRTCAARAWLLPVPLAPFLPAVLRRSAWWAFGPRNVVRWVYFVCLTA